MFTGTFPWTLNIIHDAISLYICVPAAVIPQPVSINDLGFSVYTQNPFDSLAAAIVFAQVSSWPQSTASCLSAMMHILLPCFAWHIWIIVNTCLCLVCVCPCICTGWLFDLITDLETFRTLQWIHFYIHAQNPGAFRQEGQHPPDSGTCNKSNMLQTSEKLRKKTKTLIQITFLLNRLDAPTAWQATLPAM